MADHSQNNQTGEQASTSGELCKVKMCRGDSCGRSIHHASSDVDKMPVCLMHSHDPDKSGEEFQAQVKRILEGAGDGDADLSGFVFPSANYQHRIFKAACL